MNGITHKQAKRYMRADLDGLLSNAQHRTLEAHLAGCEACRAESQSLSALTSRLQTEFHSRWDAIDGPSKQVLKNIQSQSRRIIMQKRIDTVFNVFGGAVTIAVIAFLAISLIIQFRNKSVSTASETQTSNPISSGQPYTGLLAFTSEQDGNAEIYTIHADGTGQTNLTNNSANDSNPLWSLDGKRIVFESDRTGVSQLYAMNADGSNVVQITSDNAEHHLTFMGDYRYNLWSPDGRRFLFLQKDPESKLNSLFVMDINGGNKTLLASDARSLDTFSWSPNGRYVGYVVWNEVQPGGFHPHLYIVDADGINSRELSSFLTPDEDVFTPYFWAADGQSIIFPANNYKEQHETIYQLDPQSNTATPLMVTKTMLGDWYAGVAVGDVAFSVDENQVSRPLVWQRPDGISAELDIQKGTDPANCYFGKARSLQGNLIVGLYCRNDNTVSLYWTNPDGSTIQQLPDIQVPVGKGAFSNVTISPDEKFLTFNFRSKDESNLYIWDVQAARKDSSIRPIKIAVGNHDQYYTPAWQPWVEDVTEEEPEPLIAFVMTQDYVNGEIYTMKPDGSDLTNITNNPATDEAPAWSPDGKQIAFVSDRSGGRDIYLMNADGSNVRKLTDSSTFNNHFAWSPDGTKIVYIADEAPLHQVNQLMVMNVDGSNKIALTSEPGQYSILGWSPDGQKIVYQMPDFGHQSNSRILIASTDGRSTIDGITGMDFGIPQKIQWEASDRFVISSYNFNIEPSAWQISRMFVTTDTTVYNGFNPMLVTTAKPIVAIFERTYITEDQDALRWFVFDGAPIPMSPWYFPNECDTPQRSDPALQDTFHTIAPGRQQAFVVLYCKEGVRFFLENADGTKVQQLDKSLANPAQVTGAEWSPDGRHVLVTIASNKGTELYRFDIQEMLNNQTMQPTRLATASAMIYGAAWQPIVNNDVVEEEPTPEPLTFTLTVNEAEALARFDVLEPAYIPAGYTLEGVAYDSQTQKVGMKYISQQSEGVLFIYQQRGDFVHDPAIQAYVTPVPIGKVEAEYVQGAWIYDTPTTTTPRWDPSAAFYSLTWQKDAITYSIEFIGGETITPLLLSEFIAIVESLK